MHPQRSILTRALGIGPDVEPNVGRLAHQPGDRILLCTDGLFTEVDDSEMAAVLSDTGDPGAAAAKLVRRATEGGGNDNVSVIVIDVN